jgi:hypothetical protein
MRPISKEEPNTKNVVIWPEKILKEIRRVEDFDLKEKRRKPIKRTVSSGERNVSKSSRLLLLPFQTERLEYYLFIAVGSITWILIANAILRWHKFPFHKHPLEIILIYFLPIIFIALLLYVVDFGVERSNPIKKKS